MTSKSEDFWATMRRVAASAAKDPDWTKAGINLNPVNFETYRRPVMFIRIVTENTKLDTDSHQGFRVDPSNQHDGRYLLSVVDGYGREVVIALDSEAKQALSEQLARR